LGEDDGKREPWAIGLKNDIVMKIRFSYSPLILLIAFLLASSVMAQQN
jgi:hypothetical protein